MNKNNPIYNSIRKNKILENKFNEEGERLYTDDYKALMKETEDDTDK